jgi:rhamnosyltransferase subunit B
MSDVFLICIGSHGDVHPFIGIGRAMKARGHRVRLATNERFRATVEAAGLAFVQAGDEASFLKIMSDRDVWHARRGMQVVMRAMNEGLRLIYDLVVTECTPGTIIVGSSLAMGAICAAEKFGLTMATVHLAPVCIRSTERMPVVTAGFDPNILPMWMRRKFWEGADRFVIDPLMTPELNNLRAEIGLPPVQRVQADWWHAKALTIGLWPEWFFPRPSDYPPQVRLAGFPQYDESDHQSLDPDLAAWLDAGEAPIAFTPGSAMIFGHKFFDAAVKACKILGKRGLLLTRHTDHLPKNLPGTIRHVPFVPFGLLLPRCAAVVHHGGIGTTAQGLRAGIPQLLMPMSHDQPDNAAILKRLGVGDWAHPLRFTGRNVARKLDRLLRSPAVRAKCAELAARAREDDGVERVCVLLESLKQPDAVPLPS